MKKILLTFLSLIFISPLFADIEVVVTASRLKENPGTIPASIYVIPNEKIIESESLLDAIDRVPGIHLLSNSGSEGNTYLSMCGFGENAFGRILILINGIPVNRPDMAAFNWLSIPVSNVEKIEILQGTASSLYGDACVAGVINIITKTSDAPGIEITASLDSNLGNRESISLMYGNDLFNVMALGSRTDDLTSRERTNSSMLSANADMGWRPLDGLSFRLSGSCTTSSYQMPGGLTREEYTADPDQALNTEDQTDETLWSIRFNPEYITRAVSLSSSVSFDRTITASDFASYFSYSDTLLDNISINPQFSLNLSAGNNLINTTSIGSDIRFSSINVERFPSSTRETATFAASINKSSFGFWFRDKINFAGIFIMDGGIRYEKASVSAKSVDDIGVNGSADASPFVFDAGISFLPSKIWKISTRYGSVFRYPFLDEQVSYLGYGYDTFYSDLRPESGQNLTASIGYVSNGFNASFSPYLLFMSDEIVYDPDLSANVNSTDRTIHFGGSVSAGYENNLFSLASAYSYNQTEFSEGIYEGKILPLVPQHQADWTFTISLPADFTLSSSLAYCSGFYMGGDYANSEEIISKRIDWDAYLEWIPSFIDNLRLKAGVKNILNDRTPTLAYYSSFSSTSSYYPTSGIKFELSTSWTY